MSSGSQQGVRRGSERRTLFPWMLVGAGALVYWTIALGIGIPSLADALGAPRSMEYRSSALDTRCVTTVSVDGRPVAFGDCFNVRFMLDSPELARPPMYTVPRSHPQIRAVPPTMDVQLDPQPDPVDSVGRTAY